MKILKRLTAILLVLVLAVANIPTIAFAATEGTTTTVDKTYRCTKNSDTGVAGTAPIGDSRFYWHYNAAGTSLNCPIRFMKEKGTDTPVYCIEMGAEFESSNWSTHSLTDSPFWNNLSATAQRGITYTTMYGYPVDQYGAKKCDAYAATQVLLWEFQKGYRNLTGRTNDTLYKLMIKGSPAEAAYNKIAAAVEAHAVRPSFSYGATSTANENAITLKYDGKGTWAVTLTDSKGVLSGYDVYSNGGLSVSKNGNTMTISTTKETDHSAVTLARPLPKTGQALLMLDSTVNQRCIVGQLQDPVYSYLALNTEKVAGKVSVIKENENGEKLASVTFSVYSDAACTKELTKITTGADGTGTSGDLDASTYPTVYVKETAMTDAQNKVYKLNGTVYPVNLVSGSTVTANDGKAVINEWKDGKVSVIKENENGEKLASVTFTVFDDKDCKTAITEITTGADGIGTSADIDVGKTGSRTVYVKETKITDEHGKTYSMNGTVYPVTVKAGQTVTANDGKPVINEWIPGKVSVVKENENSERLSGVTFTVFSDEKCENKITEMVTDKDGKAVSEGISVGKSGSRTVYVIEKSLSESIKGKYKIENTVYPVEITANKTSAVNQGQPVINKWKNGKVSVIKENENGEKLAGVTFTVYEDSGCTKEITKITTGTDGKGTSAEITVNKAGTRTVYVRETAVTDEQSKTYKVNSTVYSVTVSAGETVAVNEGKPVVNEWLPGRFALEKEAPSSAKINGVHFKAFSDSDLSIEAVDINGKPIELITDEKGFAVSEDIRIDSRGTTILYIVETKISSEWSKSVAINTGAVYKAVITPNTTTAINDGKPIINRWYPGTLSFVKCNRNGECLEGVTFGVFDDPECTKPTLDTAGKEAVYVTDRNGTISSTDIAMDDATGRRTVYVKELSLTDEQAESIDINRNVFRVELLPAQNTAVNGGTVIDEWLPGQLELNKLDEDGNTMAGVVFGIFSDEKCTEPVYFEENTYTIETDDAGYAFSGGIRMDKDGTRTVYVRELFLTASDSDIYELNPTVFKVMLEAGKLIPVNNNEPIIDDFKTAPVKIKKSDFTTAEGVPGATIQIFNSNGELEYEGVTKEDGNTEEIELRVGKYSFVETIAPDGYVLNKTVFEFTINPDKSITGDCEVTDKPVEWTITKQDITTADPLPGAEITLYDADGKEVFKGKTKEDGTVTAFYLAPGEYTFKETYAPEGYVINEEIFSFTVDSEGNVTGDNTVTDRRIVGSVRVIKKSDDGSKLAGAVFGIFTPDGKTELMRGMTGDDGAVTFEDLEYGKYVVKELEAPIGFLMKVTNFEINVMEDGATVELEVTNTREPFVPKTGDNPTGTLIAILLMLASAATIFMLWFTKRNKDFIHNLRRESGLRIESLKRRFSLS